MIHLPKIAFTGTRDGCSDEQIKWLLEILGRGVLIEAHQGCCIGADATVAILAEQMGHKVVGHPPEAKGLISSQALLVSDLTMPPLPYLKRNRLMVDICDSLIAFPVGPEELRSGTWSTIRHARRKGKYVIIVFPDGTVLH